MPAKAIRLVMTSTTQIFTQPQHPPLEMHSLVFGREIGTAVQLLTDTVRATLEQPDSGLAHWVVSERTTKTYTKLDVRVCSGPGGQSIRTERLQLPLTGRKVAMDTAALEAATVYQSIPLAHVCNKNSGNFDTNGLVGKLSSAWRGEKIKRKR